MCYIITVAVGPLGDPRQLIRVARKFECKLVVVSDHAGQVYYPPKTTLLQGAWHCDCSSSVGKGETRNQQDLDELESWRAVLLASPGEWVGLIKSWSRDENLPFKVEDLEDREELTDETLLRLPHHVLLRVPPEYGEPLEEW